MSNKMMQECKATIEVHFEMDAALDTSTELLTAMQNTGLSYLSPVNIVDMQEEADIYGQRAPTEKSIDDANVIAYAEFEVGIYHVAVELRKFGNPATDVQLETHMDGHLVSVQTFAAAEYYNHLPKVITRENLAQHNQTWLKDMAMTAVFDRAYSAVIRPAVSSRFLQPEPTLNAAVVQGALKDSMTGTIKAACAGGYTPISEDEGARVVAAFEVIKTAAEQWADLTGVDLTAVTSRPAAAGSRPPKP